MMFETQAASMHKRSRKERRKEKGENKKKDRRSKAVHGTGLAATLFSKLPKVKLSKRGGGIWQVVGYALGFLSLAVAVYVAYVFLFPPYATLSWSVGSTDKSRIAADRRRLQNAFFSGEPRFFMCYGGRHRGKKLPGNPAFEEQARNLLSVFRGVAGRGADTNSFSSSVVDCSAPLPGSKQSILQRFKLPVPAGHGTRKTSSGNGIAFFVANGERPESLPNDMWYALSEGHAGSSAAIHDFIRSQTKASLKKVKKTSALKDRCLDRGHGAVAALVLVDGAKPSASERGALKRLMAKYRTVRWCIVDKSQLEVHMRPRGGPNEKVYASALKDSWEASETSVVLLSNLASSTSSKAPKKVAAAVAGMLEAPVSDEADSESKRGDDDGDSSYGATSLSFSATDAFVAKALKRVSSWVGKGSDESTAPAGFALLKSTPEMVYRAGIKEKMEAKRAKAERELAFEKAARKAEKKKREREKKMQEEADKLSKMSKEEKEEYKAQLRREQAEREQQRRKEMEEAEQEMFAQAADEGDNEESEGGSGEDEEEEEEEVLDLD